MQITFNQSEVEGILAAHVATYFPHIEPEAVTSIQVNEDGTALVLIGEEHNEDAPPVVNEDKPVQRRRRRSNPAEAKHVPVEAKKELEQPAETPTTVGGQNGSSTQEAKEAEQGEQTEPTEQLKEDAPEQGEETAPDEASQQAEVKQEVQEEKAAKAPAAKPSLFANLKR
ncbi:hypothetical protein [Salmonella enterica]|uniref:hypothetical protein n=1 Tax=Salmonella enterica TaxID=28901 RepID=UPI0022378A5D|nr:hypothetical protein [Salmonella enterica]MCW6831683.1 hypothetical protein [Salmonella enterica]